jgi:hypothetical protein
MTAIFASSFATPARARLALGLLAAGLAAGSLGAGCAPPESEYGERALPGGLPVAVTRAEFWRPVPHFDGSVDGGGPKVTCDASDLRVEGSMVEISTAECNYAMLRQPSLVRVAAGDEVALRVWWGALDAPEPATAHLRLFFGFNEVWQESVEIPAPAGMREVRAVSPVDQPEGVPITFIVSNHGANTWSLSELATREPE